ncbi:MAG: pilM [Bacillales bacterium]|jgi:hypothetical protein|nr:pilM [Bacillales bacterium]
MSNSIYISNSEIQIVKYSRSGDKVKIDGYVSSILPEGCIINGVITDYQLLVGQLKRLKEEAPSFFTKLTLTVDTNSILTKKIPVPQLKRDKYYLIVEDELRGRLSAYRDVLFDFSFWNKRKKGTVILGAGVDKTAIDAYLTVFKEANIKLDHIHVGLESILRYLEHFKFNHESTFALNIIDKVSMLSLIFDKGEFVFSTRSRIMGESAIQIAQSVIQNLSQLFQFNKNITHSFYLGANDELLSEIKNRNPISEVEISQFNFNVETKGDPKMDPSLHFVLFGTYADDKHINFLDSFKRLEKANKKPSKFKPIYLLGFLIPIGIAGTFQFLNTQTNKIESENEKIKSFLKSEDVREQKRQIKVYQETINQLSEVNKNIDLGIEEFKEITTINSETVNSIYGLAGNQVTIKSFSFDSDSNSFDISASANSQLDISTYGSRLKETNLFSDVQYLGYQGSESSMVFTFKIKAILKSVEKSNTK